MFVDSLPQGFAYMEIPTEPWEPKTFIFGGYNPYIGGLKPFIFHGFGVQRKCLVEIHSFFEILR